MKNLVLLSISIVSHGHQNFVQSLIKDLVRIGRKDMEVILTWNLENEKIEFSQENLPFKLRVICNNVPKGFAENHNAAFRASSGANFVILNPDISLTADPFPALLRVIKENDPAICAPLITDAENQREDSARHFPSPFSLVKKAFTKIVGTSTEIDKVPETENTYHPDWIAGMFMVIPRNVFVKLNGLHERYHLYYEDVDFCARARCNGIKILVSKKASAIHHAQRKSHRSLRFFKWHLQSATKFFLSSAYLKLMLNRIFPDRQI